MSWTWKGFWGDDPVYRFKDDNFFQSGRHKAEERFWVNYIHNDGSFYKPLRIRFSSSSSSSFGSRTRNTSSETHSLPDVSNISPEETENSGSVKNTNNDTIDEVDEDKDDEKMSSLTCLTCSRCTKPINNPEKERYVSRIGWTTSHLLYSSGKKKNPPKLT